MNEENHRRSGIDILIFPLRKNKKCPWKKHYIKFGISSKKNY